MKHSREIVEGFKELIFELQGRVISEEEAIELADELRFFWETMLKNK